MTRRISFFVDKNPCVDEYVGEAVGLFIGKFCLFGVWSKYDQYAVILFNHGIGIWFEKPT